MVGGRRPRPRKGDRRIDAAIDHFKLMGYAEADIRDVVNQLLEVYGQHGWMFLEEDAYRVVQDALFEKEEQQEQPQLPQQQEEDPQEQEEQLQPLHEVGTQQKEAAMYEAPVGNDIPIVEVHNEIPADAELAVERVYPVLIDKLSTEATMPHPAVTGTHRTRRPCYGWISESESDLDNEEQPATQKHEIHVPSLGGGLLRTRKRRLSRCDVK